MNIYLYILSVCERMYYICMCVYVFYIYIYTPTIVVIHSRGVITLLAILQDSQVEVCFCALRIPPVDLAIVHYLDGFSLYIYMWLYGYICICK